uniref:Major facilitator superfamily (MFS) profile domain-containing protein n=1 Tax=Chromera velia CCMP2878 TaxID=1169474 RepID=A0A0G4H930_9ALVE|eukprot:Cvel_5888.t1-p1 / transcript=Cvel_5888.t1 / gene=Cvel_5888 / organism=Chromera_velia_CCMP2878 / gene_product=hypothetical protein / transcript_product=hypothetical protein / location=Cvel_scaffold280:87644-90007(-) / protein_length=621 / sequence_SO=supercontig / SO=protein_coding / is_pseudo=false
MTSTRPGAGEEDEERKSLLHTGDEERDKDRTRLPTPHPDADSSRPNPSGQDPNLNYVSGQRLSLSNDTNLQSPSSLPSRPLSAQPGRKRNSEGANSSLSGETHTEGDLDFVSDCRLMGSLWALVFLHLLCMVVIVPVLPRMIHLSPAWQSLVFAVSPLCGIAFALPAGRLVDRLTWRPLVLVPCVTLLACAFFFLLAAFWKKSPGILLTLVLMGRVSQGTGGAFLWPVALTAIAGTRPRHRVANSIGWLYTGNVGALVGVPISGSLYDSAGLLGLFEILFLAVLVCCLGVVLARPSSMRGGRERQLRGDGEERVLEEGENVPLAKRTGGEMEVEGDGSPSGSVEKESEGSLFDGHLYAMFGACTLSWAFLFAVEALAPLYWKFAFPSVSPGAVGAYLTPMLLGRVALTLCGAFAISALGSLEMHRRRQKALSSWNSQQGGEGMPLSGAAALSPSADSVSVQQLELSLLTSRFAHWACLWSLVVSSMANGGSLWYPSLMGQALLLAVVGAATGLLSVASVVWLEGFAEDRGQMKRYGQASAVLSMATNVGAVFGPVCSALVAQFGKSSGGRGHEESVRAASFLPLAMTVLGCVGMASAFWLAWSLGSYPRTLGKYREKLLIG